MIGGQRVPGTTGMDWVNRNPGMRCTIVDPIRVGGKVHPVLTGTFAF